MMKNTKVTRIYHKLCSFIEHLKIKKLSSETTLWSTNGYCIACYRLYYRQYYHASGRVLQGCKWAWL